MKWAALIFIGVIGAGMLLGGIWFGFNRYQLHVNGRHAQGLVVDQEITTGKHGSRIPIIEFSAENGQKQRFIANVEIRAIATGTTVDVVYDPKDPSHAQLGPVTWRGPITVAAFGILFLIVGTAVFHFIEKSDRASEDSRRSFERVRLPWRSTSRIYTQGEVREVRPLRGEDRGLSVFVCIAQRPKGTYDEEFVSAPVRLGQGYVLPGKQVDIYFNPDDPKGYYIDLDPLLPGSLKTPGSEL